MAKKMEDTDLVSFLYALSLFVPILADDNRTRNNNDLVVFVETFEIITGFEVSTEENLKRLKNLATQRAINLQAKYQWYSCSPTSVGFADALRRCLDRLTKVIQSKDVARRLAESRKKASQSQMFNKDNTGETK